jgi:LysM repeat protein
LKRALISAAVAAAAGTLASAPVWASPASAQTWTSQAVEPGQAAYTVVPGDSFWAIGQRFGVTMQDLAAWNHLNLWSPLDSGWTLQIPPVGWHYAGSPSSSAYQQATYAGYSQRNRYASSSGGSASAPTGTWACIAAHESGSDPSANTGNGYYGMYQFSLGTWRAAGGTGNPANASVADQTAVALRVQQQQGWSAWPTTSRECGA